MGFRVSSSWLRAYRALGLEFTGWGLQAFRFRVHGLGFTGFRV